MGRFKGLDRFLKIIFGFNKAKYILDLNLNFKGKAGISSSDIQFEASLEFLRTRITLIFLLIQVLKLIIVN